jgi:hypothetical protein
MRDDAASRRAIVPPPDLVPLSAMEEGFYRGHLRVVAVCALEGCVEAAPLDAAIAALERQHPKLRAAPVRDGAGRLAYSPGGPVAPTAREVLDVDLRTTDWRGQARTLIEGGPTPPAPWVTVVVLRDRGWGRSTLMLAVHHAVADGQSLLTLVADLLAAYAAAEAGPAPAADPAPPRALVSDARVARPIGLRNRLWLMRRAWRIDWQEARRDLVRLPRSADVAPLAQWQHWVFPKDQTLRLVRRLRTERASLNALLVAATCHGLVDTPGASSSDIKWQVAYDVRAALRTAGGGVGPYDLGSFIALMRGLSSVPPGAACWETARRVQAEIDAFVHHEGPAFAYRVVQLVGHRGVSAITRVRAAWRTDHESLTERTRPTVFATHYGALSMRDRYGALRLHALTLGMRGEPRAQPRLVIEGLVLEQCLNVAFLAPEPLEPAFWSRLGAAVHARLASATA